MQDRRTKEVMGNPGGLGSFLCSHWPTSKAILTVIAFVLDFEFSNLHFHFYVKKKNQREKEIVRKNTYIQRNANLNYEL